MLIVHPCGCRVARGSLPSGVVLLAAALVLATVGLLVYGVLSVLTTPREQVQHLPRAVWLLLVVVLPIGGSVAWLRLGRPADPVAAPRPARTRTAPPPDDDAAFLRQLRERADGQRAEAERRRREAAERDEADRRPPGDPRPEPPPA